jgi:predicted dehydrogenase
MTRPNRRAFLKGSLAAFGAGFAIGGTKSSGRILGANDTIRLGVAGLNGRGSSHVGEFSGMDGVQVTYLIDPDTRTFGDRLATVKRKGGNTPKTVQDIRRALDDKELDAVSVATPNHWHSLITIWACQAGKDVYVEKPSSHNVREGRVAVEAARKHDRIVQHGTQSRSSRRWAQVAEIARQGKLGKLLISRGLCYKPRNSIGIKPDTQAPPEVDYNLWLGPAADHPFNENYVHYNWHWFWDFGNGDIGNQGVHQMDIARWMIPGATLPQSVMSLGGRFGYKDQGETPNTELTVMDFGGTPLVFEVRGLKTDDFHGVKVGNILHFEGGIVTDNGFYPDGKTEKAPLPEVEASRGPGGGHFENFIAAVRSRKTDDLNADILDGHYSSALCHLANISYRLGEVVSFNGGTPKTGDCKEMTEALGRMEAHLSGGNGIKLDGLEYRLGRKLAFDAKAERFVDNPEADRLLTRAYREPFVVPEKIG